MKFVELREKIFKNAIEQYNDNDSMWFLAETDCKDGEVLHSNFMITFNVIWNGTEADIKRLEHHGEGLIEDTDIQYLHISVDEIMTESSNNNIIGW